MCHTSLVAALVTAGSGGGAGIQCGGVDAFKLLLQRALDETRADSRDTRRLRELPMRAHTCIHSSIHPFIHPSIMMPLPRRMADDVWPMGEARVGGAAMLTKRRT